jgi:hypothetical protein
MAAAFSIGDPGVPIAGLRSNQQGLIVSVAEPMIPGLARFLSRTPGRMLIGIGNNRSPT